MLKQLHATPGIDLAIMTSKQKYEFERDVTPLGLDQYFSQFVFFEDTKRGKPAPDPILLAMKRAQADLMRPSILVTRSTTCRRPTRLESSLDWWPGAQKISAGSARLTMSWHFQKRSSA